MGNTEITDSRIDGGAPFDWGRASEDYARYRDIYPEAFYRKIIDRGLCVSGQNVLDLGTGTGVIPRNMYRFGAKWTGTDISPEQIEQAKRLSLESGMDIEFHAVSAEELDYPPGSFDVITACQCFWYFDHERVAPVLYDLLRPKGILLVLYMAWLPYEDRIAGASEEIVLKYSPKWSGAGEKVRPIEIPDAVLRYFEPLEHEEFRLMIPFTRESWHGRMRACRGVGASLSGEELDRWEKEHWHMLGELAPDRFEVRHYGAMAMLRKREI